MASRTQSQHRFAEAPRVDLPRSVFNRSCGIKTAFDSGYLIPFFMDEALPGDTFSMKMTHFARMATPIAPFMDNLYLDVFFFAVPIRLIWDNFQEFMGEEVDGPGTLTDRLAPILDGVTIAEESIGDYFGIPPNLYPVGYGINSLPFRAYNLVYNEWFRDQNLVDPVVVQKDDGPDDWFEYNLLRRAKRHDYFTSGLPWLVKGDLAQVPILGTAPVVGIPNVRPQFDLNQLQTLDLFAQSGSATTEFLPTPTSIGTLTWASTGLEVNLGSSTGATVNAIRNTFAVQRLFEKDARGGTRYTEIVRTHFGVVSPDARLQRPEYLGGYSSPIHVNPVAQTSETATTAQGNLAAYATSSHTGRGFTKSFTEHCYVLGIVNVRADLNYQQGIPRQFLRRTRYDFYWPSLSMLPEQAIESREIYADTTGDADLKTGDYSTFAYIPRYDEYRFKPSVISGKMRSQSATPLDVWHLAQEFGSRPTLNESFIEENPPVSRVVATPDEPEFLFDAFCEYRCARPMPVFSVPGLVDHF